MLVVLLQYINIFFYSRKLKTGHSIPDAILQVSKMKRMTFLNPFIRIYKHIPQHSCNLFWNVDLNFCQVNIKQQQQKETIQIANWLHLKLINKIRSRPTKDSLLGLQFKFSKPLGYPWDCNKSDIESHT